MLSLDEVMAAFNARLEKDGFSERFELQTRKYMWEGKEKSYEAIVIPHPQEDLSIELSCEGGEWILYYLGSHSHLDFFDTDGSWKEVETLEDLVSTAYDGIVSVLKDERISVSVYRDDGSLSMVADGCVPKEIPYTFSDEERGQARKARGIAWSGRKITEDEKCHLLFSWKREYQ